MGFIATSHGCSKAAQEVEKDARRSSSSDSRHGIAEAVENTSQHGQETDGVFLNTFQHVSDLEPNFPFARSNRLALNEPQS